MIKTVIFDIDGTMYDYNAGNRVGMAALKAYCEEQFGVDEHMFRETFSWANQEMGRRIGMPCAAVHNRLIRYQLMLEKLGQPLFPHARTMYHVYWDALVEAMQPSDGLIEWMRQLKADGVQIGIGSNMTAYIQYKKLEKLGVTPYIDWIVTSEEAGCEKPERRFFELCLAKSGVQPQECLFVGDSLEGDIKGAAAVGMQTLQFVPEQEHPEAGRQIRSYRECLREEA